MFGFLVLLAVIAYVWYRLESKLELIQSRVQSHENIINGCYDKETK